MPTIAHCTSDLSSLTVYTAGQAHSFTPSSLPESPSPLDLRARIDEAASFLSRIPTLKKRLDTLVIMTNDAAVMFESASSPASPVAAAAIESSSADWGSILPTRGVSPLTEYPDKPRSFEFLRPKNEPATPQASAGSAFPILTVPDAVIRLFLDKLDRKGFKAPRVITLWHALAQSSHPQANTNDLQATLLFHDHAITYALHVGLALYAGGRIALQNTDGQQTADRLTLDLLTWSSRLGLPVSKLTNIHNETTSPADTLPPALNHIKQTSHQQPDPLAWLLSKAAETPHASPAQQTLNRSNISRLTTRPGKNTRRAYRAATLSLLLTATAIGIFAHRVGSFTDKFAQARTDTAVATESIIQATFSNFDPSTQNVYTYLQTLQRELDAKEPQGTPPAPPPWVEDIKEITEFIANFDDVHIADMRLEPIRATITLRGEGITPEIATDFSSKLSTTQFRRFWRANVGNAASQNITITSTQ